MDRDFFWDEEVLRIQNEVRRNKDEQRLHDSDVDDKMQRLDSSGSDSAAVSSESRNNFLQDAPTDSERK